jgi:hypothetical protein
MVRTLRQRLFLVTLCVSLLGACGETDGVDSLSTALDTTSATDAAADADTSKVADTTVEDTTAAMDTAIADSATAPDTAVKDTSPAPDTVVQDTTNTRGPAYEAKTAGCSAADGTRRIKLVNNCTEGRWFKMDGKTTPLWARPVDCPWHGSACTDIGDITQCTKIAKDAAEGDASPGNVWCLASGEEGEGSCHCNPYFKLAPGEAHEIEMAKNATFSSATGWLADGCNAYGGECTLGNDSARNSLFEFTYDSQGSLGENGQWTGGLLWYDISAVNSWTRVSPVGMKSCGGAGLAKGNNKFWCGGTGCRFDVATQCPDGSAEFKPAPEGCASCPTKIVDGKKVLDGACGPCSDGQSANLIPTETTFNLNNIGGDEWTWLGPPDFAVGWGYAEGPLAARRYHCTYPGPTCVPAGPDATTNTCLGGCDLCTISQGASSEADTCIKYCCPDMVKTYGAFDYRFDSAGCHALGVQAGTNYTVALKEVCPYVYTFGYEDHTSTFTCDTQASLLVQACPDPTDFPSVLSD